MTVSGEIEEQAVFGFQAIAVNESCEGILKCSAVLWIVDLRDFISLLL